MIFKIFSPKISAKKLAFLTQNKAKLCKKLIITLVFEKNVNFFAENWQKLAKIVIITSTPGWILTHHLLFWRRTRWAHAAILVLLRTIRPLHRMGLLTLARNLQNWKSFAGCSETYIWTYVECTCPHKKRIWCMFV
jgi:hypothetical protein